MIKCLSALIALLFFGFAQPSQAQNSSGSRSAMPDPIDYLVGIQPPMGSWSCNVAQGKPSRNAQGDILLVAEQYNMHFSRQGLDQIIVRMISRVEASGRKFKSRRQMVAKVPTSDDMMLKFSDISNVERDPTVRGVAWGDPAKDSFWFKFEANNYSAAKRPYSLRGTMSYEGGLGTLRCFVSDELETPLKPAREPNSKVKLETQLSTIAKHQQNLQGWYAYQNLIKRGDGMNFENDMYFCRDAYNQAIGRNDEASTLFVKAYNNTTSACGHIPPSVYRNAINAGSKVLKPAKETSSEAFDRKMREERMKQEVEDDVRGDRPLTCYVKDGRRICY